MESAAWLSVYGRKFRGEGETLESDVEGVDVEGDGRRRGRVRVTDRGTDREGEEDGDYGMSDGEINDFESSSGVKYDPYYGTCFYLCNLCIRILGCVCVS